MSLFVRNRQKAAGVNAQAIRGLARWLLHEAERRERAAPWGDVTVALCDDAEMTRVNRVHLRRDTTTDVIVYRYAPQPGDPVGDDGDLLVNVERAVCEGRRRARKRRGAWGPDAELALYLAHACDHFAGAEDNTPARRRTMRRRELAWVRRARLAGLVDGLIAPSPAKGPAKRRQP